MFHGYHPDRLPALRASTLRSIDDLDALRSDDPEAAAALASVRWLRRLLEDEWLALLDAIERSAAFAAWGIAAPAALARPAGRRGLLHAVGGVWVTTWTPPPSGLRGWTDEQLTARLGELVADPLRRHDELAAALSEAARRTETDPGGPHHPGFASLLGAHIGADGVDQLLAAAHSLDPANGTRLLTTTEFHAAIAEPAARLLGALAHASDALTAHLVAGAVEQPSLGVLMALAPQAFDAELVLGTIDAMLGALDTGTWFDRTSNVDEFRAGLRGALETGSLHPRGVLELLEGATWMATLLGTELVGPEPVRQLLTAGLGDAVAADAALLATGNSVLFTIVEIAGDRPLSAGAVRAVATASGHYLAALGAAIGPPDGPIDLAGPAGAIVSCAYDDLAELVRQIVADTDAQRMLGLQLQGAVHVALTEQWPVTIDALDPVFSPADALAAELAPLAELVHLVDLAFAGERDRLAYEHGAALAASTRLMLWLAIAGGVAPTFGTAARAGTALFDLLIGSAIDRAYPLEPDDTGVRGWVERESVVSFAELVLADHARRGILGLGRVTGWATLRRAVVAYRRTTDPEQKKHRYQDVRAAMLGQTNLRQYLLAIEG